ncbi:hypothetical protein PHYSODRAFT_263857 [Phytophthora sojae]|uniref:Folate-Biopterin Transporter (FBT) family n=1 Tax=Phytophthora sojae (strain P6497) TaxID=1094619 RepID=G4YQT4_PHYSP|nr:hypothetical protein PHYSODRAFT_263857 [Phytophthora sojae]EGZ30455.1 hypothetical protein PHYSODRAFT_263857 [Phytophthora sojae]|eukprot:XP_009517730.1 hypothetical protein PHYSODRAFT_263857 [Phytophthora sojae]
MAPTPSGRNVHDLERLSAVSITKDSDQSGYTGMKTPDAVPELLEDGALRPGGMPVLTSKKHIGLLFQYAAVGIVYGMLPETIYPFMQEYLNCSGAQVAAAKELVVLPWSFKVFFGILSDCLPIRGYRRRPYMMIGWTVCILMLLIMAIMPIGKPYYTVASDRDVDTSDYTPEIEARINYDAPSEGAKYIVIMFFAAVGYVLSDVCSDSIVCELAQQEPLAKRGKTQSAIYTVRTVLVIFGELLVGFCFNGEDYGGDFDFSLSFPQLMIIMTVLTGELAVTLNDVLGHVCFMIGIMVTSKYGLHWNWRGMIVFTGIVVIIVDCAVALITVWDVFRHQWFWLGPPIAVQIPSGVAWIIALFVTVEIAGVGNEGAVYGLVTTVGNLATPFATTITLLIDGPPTTTPFACITYTIIISYAMTIFSWVFLFLLPRQKEETQELARTGGSNKILGGITIFYLAFSLVWSITVNTLAVFDSTSCLVIELAAKLPCK